MWLDHKRKLESENIDLLRENRKLRQENQALRQERDILFDCQDILESLSDLTKTGSVILGVERKDDAYYAVVMETVTASIWPSRRTISLYRLPVRGVINIGFMYIELYANCDAHIVDWCSHEEDQGFGSMIMKYVLSYLRSAGFRSVSGRISSVDYDHEKKLRHFYGKFGFTITDLESPRDGRLLHLDLFEERPPHYTSDGCLVCCRDYYYNKAGLMTERPKIERKAQDDKRNNDQA